MTPTETAFVMTAVAVPVVGVGLSLLSLYVSRRSRDKILAGASVVTRNRVKPAESE